MIRSTEESHERKAKGESLQLLVRDYIRNLPNIHDPSMIQSQKMSSHGEDILMEDEVRRTLPVSPRSQGCPRLAGTGRAEKSHVFLTADSRRRL